MKKKALKFVKKYYIAYLMVLPLFVGMCIFSIYPPIRGILISFFDVYTVTDSLDKFVGFLNYKDLIQDRIFLDSIKTMFTLQIPRFIVNCTIPFIYGELLYLVKNKKLKALYRILILLPIVCPGVVYTLIWQNIYSYDGGLLNEILKGVGLIKENIDFLDRNHIIGALIFMGFPWLPGTAGLIVLSGLINIPNDVIEASKLDGCSTFKRIFKVDLAYLIGQIKYVFVFGVINIFQDYSNQLLFADKVGTAIYVPAYYMYRLVNLNQGTGKAAAIGVLLFMVIMIITIATYRFLNRRDDDNV